ncbi:MAG: hypothetical protein ACE5M4_15540, partial [Anaerolineales bacterium]
LGMAQVYSQPGRDGNPKEYLAPGLFFSIARVPLSRLSSRCHERKKEVSILLLLALALYLMLAAQRARSERAVTAPSSANWATSAVASV